MQEKVLIKYFPTFSLALRNWTITKVAKKRPSDKDRKASKPPNGTAK